ncbi:hypothetical protein VTN96DRAFT_4609 [Rasamsonia emersonii]
MLTEHLKRCYPHIVRSTISATTKNPSGVISALQSADPGVDYDGVISPQILISTIDLCGTVSLALVPSAWL